MTKKTTRSSPTAQQSKKRKEKERTNDKKRGISVGATVSTVVNGIQVCTVDYINSVLTTTLLPVPGLNRNRNKSQPQSFPPSSARFPISSGTLLGNYTLQSVSKSLGKPRITQHAGIYQVRRRHT